MEITYLVNFVTRRLSSSIRIIVTIPTNSSSYMLGQAVAVLCETKTYSQTHLRISKQENKDLSNEKHSVVDKEREARSCRANNKRLCGRFHAPISLVQISKFPHATHRRESYRQANTRARALSETTLEVIIILIIRSRANCHTHSKHIRKRPNAARCVCVCVGRTSRRRRYL